MTESENGVDAEKTEETLHPCCLLIKVRICRDWIMGTNRCNDSIRCNKFMSYSNAYVYKTTDNGSVKGVGQPIEGRILAGRAPPREVSGGNNIKRRRSFTRPSCITKKYIQRLL
nr:hypothetical protein [Tanacetum cinerariifolium]